MGITSSKEQLSSWQLEDKIKGEKEYEQREQRRRFVQEEMNSPLTREKLKQVISSYCSDYATWESRVWRMRIFDEVMNNSKHELLEKKIDILNEYYFATTDINRDKLWRNLFYIYLGGTKKTGLQTIVFLACGYNEKYQSKFNSESDPATSIYHIDVDAINIVDLVANNKIRTLDNFYNYAVELKLKPLALKQAHYISEFAKENDEKSINEWYEYYRIKCTQSKSRELLYRWHKEVVRDMGGYYSSCPNDDVYKKYYTSCKQFEPKIEE
jgi:hypothetical protein